MLRSSLIHFANLYKLKYMYKYTIYTSISIVGCCNHFSYVRKQKQQAADSTHFSLRIFCFINVCESIVLGWRPQNCVEMKQHELTLIIMFDERLTENAYNITLRKN